MRKIFFIFMLLYASCAQAGTIQLRDEGFGVGTVDTLDCVGSTVVCSSNQGTGTINSSAGTGTVTSITQGTGMNFSVNPITTTGTINLATPVAIANGGTNNTAAYPACSVVFSNGTLLTQDSSNLCWDNVGKKLGIGTSSPLQSLHIDGATNGTLAAYIRNTTNGTGANAQWAFLANTNISNVVYAFSPAYTTSGQYIANSMLVEGGAADGGATFSARETGPLRFYTANAERARFSTTGNFGIGNTSPGTLLTLGTAGTTAGTLSMAGSTSGTVTLAVPAVSGTNTATFPAATGTVAVSATAPITLSSAGAIGLTTPLSIANGGTNNSTAYTAGSVIFSNGTSLTQNNAQLFWDNTNNRLGLNTTTPAAPLEIIDAGTTANILHLKKTTAGINAYFLLETTQAAQQAAIELKTGTANADWIEYIAASSTDLNFYSVSALANRLVIQTGGNVGIGASNPADKLEVSGAVGVRMRVSSTDNLLAGIRILANGNSWFLDNRATSDTPNNRLGVFDNLGTERLTLLQTGNVGIGVANPQATLDLQGSFRTITTSTSVNLSLTTAHQTILATTGAGGITLTLPAASANTIGLIYYCVKVDAGAGALTIAGAGADTVNGAASKTLSTQYATARVVGISATAWAADSLAAL